MKRRGVVQRSWWLVLALVLSVSPVAFGVSRFPPPQFTETGHQLPKLVELPPRSLTMQYVDVGILLVVLSLSTWLALKRRSRRGLVWLGVFSVLYFGFYRKGCICAIGAIQNIAQGAFDPNYVVPMTALAFGLIPIGFALFFGRTFCAAACPHGALQDLVLLKPITLPNWLEHGLRMLAYVYLGLAVVFAATGGGYIICQWDPFVPLFRMSGSALMVGLGVAFLLGGIFVGRPYCRFLCPYGVLLGMAGTVSKWRVRITPDTCTSCRLCEQSCPFNAINKSSLVETVDTKVQDVRRLGWLLLVAPLILVAGIWLGGMTGQAMVRKHPRVNLAERIHLEEAGKVTDTTDASAAYRATGKPLDELFDDATAIRSRYIKAGRWCGGWIGLVIAAKLVGLAMKRRRKDYEADQMRCVACARCYNYCPQEHLRIQNTYGVPMPPEMAAKAVTPP
jgi:polyferredoxin